MQEPHMKRFQSPRGVFIQRISGKGKMVMSAPFYSPSCGDVVWLDLSPQAGRGHSGRRPALCISPVSYNERVGLGIFCPVTSKQKGYPFEVVLPAGLPLVGVILSDQVKSLDWQSRQAEYICKVPQETLAEVLQKLQTLIS